MNGAYRLNDGETRLPDLDLNAIPAGQLNNLVLCESEVEDILSTLNPSKSSGPDLISPRLLKASAGILKYPLCKLFNLSLEKTTYPSQWKKANVTPVF